MWGVLDEKMFDIQVKLMRCFDVTAPDMASRSVPVNLTRHSPEDFLTHQAQPGGECDLLPDVE